MMEMQTTPFLEQRYKKLRETLGTDDRINSRMGGTLAGCNEQQRALTLAFTVEEWMLNPSNTMHGGLITTAMDITFGTLTVLLSDFKRCPTVELNTHYISPVLQGDTLLITARCLHLGRATAHLVGEAVSKTSGRTCAAGTAVFYVAGTEGYYERVVK